LELSEVKQTLVGLVGVALIASSCQSDGELGACGDESKCNISPFSLAFPRLWRVEKVMPSVVKIFIDKELVCEVTEEIAMELLFGLKEDTNFSKWIKTECSGERGMAKACVRD